MLYNIRPAVPADSGAIAAIQRHAGRLELSWIDGEADADAPDMAETLARIAPDIWLAEEAGRVLGFVAFKGDCILWLYVDPGHHRRGIGRALFRVARDRCGTSAYLDMLGGNDIALGLYLAEGFAIIDRRMIDVPGFARPMESLKLQRQPEIRVRA